MDWEKFKKNAAGMAVKAAASMTEEMGQRSRSLSRAQGLSDEKRDELRNKSENYKRASQQIRSYYSDTFEPDEEDDY